MTELVQVSPNQVHPEVDQLRQQLLMAQELRATAQQDYVRIKHEMQELLQEKTMLEAILAEKNQILGAPMTIWINSREITKYYKSQWREKMGIRLNHEGIITGYVYED